MADDDSMISAVGIGLKSQHFDAAIQASKQDIDFFEVHAENYFNQGGLNHAMLEQISARFALTIHGTGLGLGNMCGIEAEHLSRLNQLVQRYQPVLVSEHLSFNQAMLNGQKFHAGDLLPISWNEASFSAISDNILKVQDCLGRQILIENISYYHVPGNNTMVETDFLNMLCRQTGCGLLVDLNNLVVNAKNFSSEPPVKYALQWLKQINPQYIRQYHLAGSSNHKVDGFIIDDHAVAVTSDVWKIYDAVVQNTSTAPVLIEWDTDIPTWQVLIAQAAQAKQRLAQPSC